jgi:hypothetical protein
MDKFDFIQEAEALLIAMIKPEGHDEFSMICQHLQLVKQNKLSYQDKPMLFPSPAAVDNTINMMFCPNCEQNGLETIVSCVWAIDGDYIIPRNHLYSEKDFNRYGHLDSEKRMRSLIDRH